MLRTNWFYVAIFFMNAEVLTTDSVISNEEDRDKEISKLKLTHNNNTKDVSPNTTEIIKRFIEMYPTESWKEHGFFSEDFLTVINLHWLTFAPPDKTNHYVLAGLYVVIMLMGILGNALVIFMYLRYVYAVTCSIMFLLVFLFVLVSCILSTRRNDHNYAFPYFCILMTFVVFILYIIVTFFTLLSNLLLYLCVYNHNSFFRLITDIALQI